MFTSQCSLNLSEVGWAKHFKYYVHRVIKEFILAAVLLKSDENFDDKNDTDCPLSLMSEQPSHSVHLREGREREG